MLAFFKKNHNLKYWLLFLFFFLRFLLRFLTLKILITLVLEVSVLRLFVWRSRETFLIWCLFHVSLVQTGNTQLLLGIGIGGGH